MSLYTFTVFTAATRGNTIHRVYESLLKQTFVDFEWVIVDDGGHPSLAIEVEKFISEGKLNINYIRKENGGKHTAYNRGLKEAKGELFISLDDDDACTSDALEVFYNEWEKIKHDQDFIGINCNCINQNGELIGTTCDGEYVEGYGLRAKYKLLGEKWGFERTEILKEYLYPEPPHVKFIMEGVVQSQYNKKYKKRFINKSLRIYYEPESNEQKDNLSILTERTAIGMAYSYLYALNNNIKLRSTVKKSMVFLDDIKFLLNCWRFNLFTGSSYNQIIKNISSIKNKVVMTLMFPAGVIMSKRMINNHEDLHRHLRKQKVLPFETDL